jgi:hypothetical protein
MTAKQSVFFRTILFLLGAGIVVLAFFLLTREKELTGHIAFIWILIAVMYLVFFTPFFFSVIRISNFFGKDSAPCPRVDGHNRLYREPLKTGCFQRFPCGFSPYGLRNARF